MKRIEKLTTEQKAKLPVWRDKWIDIGLKTGETDWDTFDKYMPICYQKAGLEYPKKVIRVSSPIVGAFASSIANKILKEKGKNSVAVRGAVGDAVDGAVHVAVGVAVHGAVHGAVDDAVRDAVHDAVDVAVGDAVDDSVRGAVHGAVRGAVDVAVDVAVGDAVDGAVGVAVSDAVSGAKLNWHYWLGGQFWIGGWWGSPSYVSFFTDVCGLELDKDIQERATAYRKVCESVNYIWPNSEFLMVCARPTKIERNKEGRLHSTTGMAIQYPDGWGLYFLNGIKFEKELYEKVVSRKMPFDEILNIVDVDQRNQALLFVGNDQRDQWLKHVKAKVIDEHTKYTLNGSPVYYKLYSIPSGEMFTEEVKAMWYTCPSTGLSNFSRVPNEMTTVADSMAWKGSDDVCVLTAKDWLDCVPLIDEA